MHIYLWIITWSSMMLTACTHTPLKPKGRFVSDSHLLVHDRVAFLDNACMFVVTLISGKLFSLQPSTFGPTLFSIFQTPGGVGLPDREHLPVRLTHLLWCPNISSHLVCITLPAIFNLLYVAMPSTTKYNGFFQTNEITCHNNNDGWKE